MTQKPKPYFTIPQLIEKLKKDGLVITDEAELASRLRYCGYYRLSGYWYMFRQILPKSKHDSREHVAERSSEFIPGINFDQVWSLYCFDQKLRLLVLDAIGHIEVAIRSEIVNALGKYDPVAYNNLTLLNEEFADVNNNNPLSYTNWNKKFLEKLSQAKKAKDRSIAHYNKKYKDQLPIWVAVEIWDFGMLSNFFKGMRNKEKEIIANNFGIQSYDVLASWLRAINVVRNIAAHNSRLWNRTLSISPTLLPMGSIAYFDPLLKDNKINNKLYFVLCILAYFVRQITPASQWPSQMRNLIQTFPEIQGFPMTKAMKIPTDWHKHWFFQESA